jgi:hypothetical protein
MRNSLSDYRAWGGALLIALLIFAVVDCTSGKTRYCPGNVRQHIYHAPYVTQKCSTDKEGKTHCTTTYHPATYHLLVYIPKPEHARKVETTLLNYSRFENGASVVVGERLGRWTDLIYLDWIAAERSADY